MIKLFGSTINETIEAFKPHHLGSGKSISRGPGETKIEITPVDKKSDRAKASFRIVITFLLLFVGTYLIVSQPDQQTGGTILGAICGYWLK